MSDMADPPSALANPGYRNLWAASIVANFGTFMLMVGAAWAMVGLGEGPTLVALVQSAIVAPIFLFGIAAGTFADLYDRRRVAIVALALGLLASLVLVALTVGSGLSAWPLLFCCFLVGTGNAIFSPAWQTAVAEQVTPAQLPQAIMLNSVSYNLARSAGPGAGGLLVSVAGPLGGFLFNTVSFIPILLAFLLWRPKLHRATLPRERLGQALTAGLRYISHSAPLRAATLRALLAGLIGCALTALAPLIARDVVGGGSETFGLLLASLGAGSVVGALGQGRLRNRFGTEGGARILSLAGAAGSALVAFSTSLAPSCAGFLLAGVGIAGQGALLNVFFQTNSPRWVSARTLSAFQSVFAGGMAIGSLMWGEITTRTGLVGALELVALAFAATILVGLVYPIRTPEATPRGEPEPLPGALMEVDRLPLDVGPIVIELHYGIDPVADEAFLALMKEV
ncbi:MAG: MFS transporter, partial [Sphingopyxis sp.]